VKSALLVATCLLPAVGVFDARKPCAHEGRMAALISQVEKHPQAEADDYNGSDE
jgi:hypothetical protein